jgi:hypothetical protein
LPFSLSSVALTSTMTRISVSFAPRPDVPAHRCVERRGPDSTGPEVLSTTSIIVSGRRHGNVLQPPRRSTLR